jgi:hypothetical protein
MSDDRDLKRLLEAFGDGWNRHDLDALMSMMTGTVCPNGRSPDHSRTADESRSPAAIC